MKRYSEKEIEFLAIIVANLIKEISNQIDNLIVESKKLLENERREKLYHENKRHIENTEERKDI